ncbi:50S ribosomal protein L32 [soil metagenome]|jgi:large subunit ribosomal protein L32|nr:50S ribosomal protein L32 [Gemmatimonadota bacterium]
MAVPKRRQSKQRQRKRRTHVKAAMPVYGSCPQCGDPRVPHRICANCGYYRSVQRVEVEEI